MSKIYEILGLSLYKTSAIRPGNAWLKRAISYSTPDMKSVLKEPYLSGAEIRRPFYLGLQPRFERYTCSILTFVTSLSMPEIHEI